MTYPIYPGMDVKFQVTAAWDNFLLTGDPFEIIIRDQYGRVVDTIKRDDCLWDTDGRFYFTMENVRSGIYYAWFKGDYEDEDYNDQRARVADVQELLRVPGTVCCCPCADGQDILSCKCHKVHYRLVTVVSIDGDDCLCGSDGEYILTSDGKRICFKNDKRKQIEDMGKVYLETMTGEEFKQFIEGRNPDGRIDTVPEMMDAAQGLSDDGKTIKQEIETEVQKSDVERVDPEELENFDV